MWTFLVVILVLAAAYASVRVWWRLNEPTALDRLIDGNMNVCTGGRTETGESAWQHGRRLEEAREKRAHRLKDLAHRLDEADRLMELEERALALRKRYHTRSPEGAAYSSATDDALRESEELIEEIKQGS